MVCIVSQENLLKENIKQKYERTTKVFAKAGLDNATSAMCMCDGGCYPDVSGDILHIF